jgi:hypothetical protein
MTTSELILKLQKIVEDNPTMGNFEVGYPVYSRDGDEYFNPVCDINIVNKYQDLGFAMFDMNLPNKNAILID